MRYIWPNCISLSEYFLFIIINFRVSSLNSDICLRTSSSLAIFYAASAMMQSNNSYKILHEEEDYSSFQQEVTNANEKKEPRPRKRDTIKKFFRHVPGLHSVKKIVSLGQSHFIRSHGSSMKRKANSTIKLVADRSSQDNSGFPYDNSKYWTCSGARFR